MGMVSLAVSSVMFILYVKGWSPLLLFIVLLDFLHIAGTVGRSDFIVVIAVIAVIIVYNIVITLQHFQSCRNFSSSSVS